MNGSILVSIIINNYNYEKFLPEAIDSALTQSYPNTEVIVVDDGSTDNSRKVIEHYGDKITAHFQENGKQGGALNKGFSICHGEILFFLDADDFLSQDAVKSIVEIWSEDLIKVHFRLQIVNGESQPTDKFLPPTTMKLETGVVTEKLLRRSGYISTPMSGNAYNRKRLSNLFPIPEEYKTTADDYMMISTPFYGKIAGIEKPLGAYRIHNSNQWALTTVSGSRFRRFVLHDIQNYKLLLQRAQEFNYEVPPDLEIRGIGRIWSRLASLRLEPKEHPVKTDTVPQLFYWGIRSLWRYSDYNWPKKIIYTLLFNWVAWLPLPLSKLGFTWLYAPHMRPKFVDRILTKVRAAIS